MKLSIVCPFKKGEPKFWKFQKGGTWKKIWVGETKKGGKDFQKQSGDSTFSAEFRDKKEQKWGILETN